MKIFYTADFLIHGDHERNVPHLFNDMVFNAIKGCGVDIDILSKVMDRKVFFSLSGITNISDRYFRFSEENLSDGSVNYLKNAVGDSVIFGFELSKKTKDLLNEIGVVYVNCWIHPFKLLDDLALAFESNSDKVRASLMSFSQPPEKLELYASYWKERIKNSLKAPQILENSLLLVGQSENDQSLICGDKMLSLNDYKDDIVELSKKYNIIYSPHPSNLDRFGKLSTKNKPKLKKFIREINPKIIKGSTYRILSSDNVVAVRSISSSVVCEAKYFSKDANYFFQPLFDDSICILHDYFYKYFWAKVFDLDCSKIETTNIKFDVVQNKVRDMMRAGQLYWGYKDLDNLRILMNEKRLRDKSLFIKILRFFQKL